jgi:hypothetical protein
LISGSLRKDAINAFIGFLEHLRGKVGVERVFDEDSSPIVEVVKRIYFIADSTWQEFLDHGFLSPPTSAATSESEIPELVLDSRNLEDMVPTPTNQAHPVADSGESAESSPGRFEAEFINLHLYNREEHQKDAKNNTGTDKEVDVDRTAAPDTPQDPYIQLTLTAPGPSVPAGTRLKIFDLLSRDSHGMIKSPSIATAGIVLKIGECFAQLTVDHALSGSNLTDVSVAEENPHNKMMKWMHATRSKLESWITSRLFFQDERAVATPTSWHNGKVVSPAKTSEKSMTLHNFVLRSSRPLMRIDLDYALFRVKPSEECQTEVKLFDHSTIAERVVTVSAVAPINTSRKVLVMTSSAGPQIGMLRPDAIFICVPHRSMFEAYSVVLESCHIKAGDCGAMVIDLQTGAWCGHVVLAYPGTSDGYIISAEKIVSDISTRLGQKKVEVARKVEEKKETIGKEFENELAEAFDEIARMHAGFKDRRGSF